MDRLNDGFDYAYPATEDDPILSIGTYPIRWGKPRLPVWFKRLEVSRHA
jgi:hypothetical protein